VCYISAPPHARAKPLAAAGLVRAFAGWVIRKFFGDAKIASILTSSHKKSVHQYYKHVAEKLAFEQQTREVLWGGDLAIDAVLAPVHPIPATPHNSTKRLTLLGCSTMIWNIVQSPVGVVPVTRVDPARDELTDEWRAAPSEGSKIFEGEIYGPTGVYDPFAMRGLPVGVQIVGRPWEEEKVLAMMHVIDIALGPRGFGPGSWAPSKQMGGAQISNNDA
jgi:Asp-tRNA(Asn)/Glu-tRNA(Gln) amidotransferase A subunit family amidase